MDMSGLEMEYDEEMDMDGQDEYGSQYDAGMATTGYIGAPAGDVRLAKKKKKKKKKRIQRPLQYEDPTLREHLLAGAYGGVAKPKPKRQGVKYTTDINAGLRDIATPNAIRMDNSRRQIGQMTGSMTGLDGVGSARKHHSKPREQIGRQSSFARSREGSAIGSRVGRAGAESTSKLMDPHQREMRLKEK